LKLHTRLRLSCGCKKPESISGLGKNNKKRLTFILGLYCGLHGCFAPGFPDAGAIINPRFSDRFFLSTIYMDGFQHCFLLGVFKLVGLKELIDT